MHAPRAVLLAPPVMSATTVAFDALKRIFAETGLVGQARTAALQVSALLIGTNLACMTYLLEYMYRTDSWEVLWACGHLSEARPCRWLGGTAVQCRLSQYPTVT